MGGAADSRRAPRPHLARRPPRPGEAGVTTGHRPRAGTRASSIEAPRDLHAASKHPRRGACIVRPARRAMRPSATTPVSLLHPSPPQEVTMLRFASRVGYRPLALTLAALMTLATLRRATARYHNLDAAIDDGFILLHECESIEGEGPVGIVYYNPSRVDGAIDPLFPEALIYEPSANGKSTLVGVEFAVPNMGQPAPEFLGATFQSEEDIGVYALHVWVWRHNPEGMFAETNSRVSCGVE